MAEDESNEQPLKYFDSQFDDEKVLFVFRRHPVVMRRGLIISLLAWLVGPLIILVLTYLRPTNPPTIVAFFLALAASIVLGSLLLLPAWISWYFSIFIVTTQRFVQITQKGLFHSSFADMNLAQIQQVNYKVAGLQATLLGFGIIEMQTYIGEVVIHDAPHPAKTQREIVQILRDQGVVSIDSPFKKANMLSRTNEERRLNDIQG
jgi:signal transduction histidine kinase